MPAALVTALVLVVVLALQNRALRIDVIRERIKAHAPRLGTIVPAFRGVTLAGDTVDVGRGATEVLLFFNTTCPVCKQTLPQWETIAARAGSGERVKVYGVGLDGDFLLRVYAREHAIGFDVVALPDTILKALYRVDAVPLTLVLDRNGRVVLSRLGNFETTAAADSVLRVALAADSISLLRNDSTLTRRL